MENLSLRERELVAIGAAIASNCIPCIEYHIPAAKKAGLNENQIMEAIKVAESVKQVPADKVIETAKSLVKIQEEECNDPSCECRQDNSQDKDNSCC